jgi:hypothetical protein
MRVRFAFLAVWMAAAPVGALPARAQDKLAEKVAADLKAYYADDSRQPFIQLPGDPPREKRKAPPWEEPLKKLSGSDAAQRDQAAAYLRALVAQAFKDERSGAVPWRATPFFHGEMVNSAVALRERVAGELAESKGLPAALPVLRWYLEEEKKPSTQATIMKALGKIDTKEADALRGELAAQPHTNAFVVLEALEQIMARKQTLPADKLALLCQHYRASIREKARKLNELHKGADPGNFDSAKAMQSPAVRKLLDDVARLMIDPPPTDAKFVKVTTTYLVKGKKNEPYTVRGWLLKEMGGKAEILTPFGRRQNFELHENAVPLPEKEEGSTTCTMEVVTPRQEVNRLNKLRNSEDDRFPLSERGGLTAQFERGSGVSLYEIMIVHWLHSRKDDDLAAKILFPALDNLYRDDFFMLTARGRLGELLGQQLLVAFVGDRDYAKAEKLAQALAERYPETRFHDIGVRLSKELPRRQDDFKKLALPSAKEWAAIKPKLTRSEQIEYLCQRIRLLNSFQWGQPGGVAYSATQYAEPCGMSENAAWSGKKGKTEVINPLVELMGPVDGFRLKGEQEAKGLELTVVDIAHLAPFLKDDWYLLMVSFHRDFGPDRHLHSSRGLFTVIINSIAKQDICRRERFGTMNPQEQDKHIQGLVAWSKANAGKNESELLIAGLEDGLRNNDDWADMVELAGRLVELKEKKAAPALLRFLDSIGMDDYGRQEVLGMCRRLDRDAAKDASAKYLKHARVGLRVEAALIQFEAGNQKEGREVLAAALADGPLPNQYEVFSQLANSRRRGLSSKSWLYEVVDLLLKEGSKPSQKAARQLLSNGQFVFLDEPDDRVRVLRRFADAKLADGFQFYLKLLRVEGNELGPRKLDRPVAETFADEVTNRFAPGDPDIRKIMKQHPKTADRIPALRTWLEDRAKDPRSVSAAEK